jgi:hypothetical protein
MKNENVPAAEFSETTIAATKRNQPKQISSVMNLCLIGIFTTMLAASLASSQTAATAGSGAERTAQQQSSDGSSSDTDTEIIQELG